MSEAKVGVYGVAGMTCQGCVRSVEKALVRALPGVAVEVSLPDGKVKVAGAHTPAEVAEAVEGAGFDYTGPVG